jgi:hypothetical protein
LPAIGQESQGPAYLVGGYPPGGNPSRIIDKTAEFLGGGRRGTFCGLTNQTKAQSQVHGVVESTFNLLLGLAMDHDVIHINP